MPFFIIFVIVPLAELMVFARVSEHIGIGTALFLAFLTAIIGGTIVRHQGLKTIFSMRGSMEKGQMPVSEIFDGFCLVAAGATLITPGFITDTIGFLLLIPAIRNAMRAYVKNHTNWAMSSTEFQSHTINDPNIIEGEFEALNKSDDDDNN